MTAAVGDDEDEVLVLDGLGQRHTFTRRAVKHMIAGGVLGFFLSLTLSSILYELSRPANALFKTIDILALLAASVALFMKQFRAQQNMIRAGASTNAFEEPETRMLAVVRVGAAAVGSGAICVLLLIVLSSLPATAKFFLILNISAAHCFLLCMGCVEFFNGVINGGSPLIARQLYTVVIASIAVGCLSGFLFGVADVEKNYESLAWEEWVAAAVCMLSGAAVGHANAVAVDDSMEIAFDPLPMDETAADDGQQGSSGGAAAIHSTGASSASMSTIAASGGGAAQSSAAGIFADDE